MCREIRGIEQAGGMKETAGKSGEGFLFIQASADRQERFQMSFSNKSVNYIRRGSRFGRTSSCDAKMNGGISRVRGR